LQQTIKLQIQQLKKTPSLHVIVVGDFAPSAIYVQKKVTACHNVGIASTVHALDKNITTQVLVDKITALNQNPQVHGILVQLPLPDHIDRHVVLQHIDPRKDVDGLTVHNLGHLMADTPGIKPCTPQGCLQLIHSVIPNLMGMHAVIVGKSTLVGNPIGQLLLHQQATVTYTHSHTKDLPFFTRQADILVVATGVPHLIGKDHIKPGVVIIDVGISRDEKTGKIIGDVDFDAVSKIAKAITPVPGGVGPMTVVNLLFNTLMCMRMQCST
jgi:methylenetetrahydrofolate dehydrogenase (NADP+)/methenyltetrahydrofolate cyclohydrolase